MPTLLISLILSPKNPPIKPGLFCAKGGVSFGYNNLVVDMLGLLEMKNLKVPITLDATHAVQLPGSSYGKKQTASEGRAYAVPTLAKAGVAAGADGIFLEFHPEPKKAKCDGPSCLALKEAPSLLKQLQKN